MLPFGGFFLKLIGGEIIKSVIYAQVNKTVDTPTGPVVTQKPWFQSKGIWGAIGVLGYVAFSVYTGTPIDITDINSIIANGGNIFLTVASILSMVGRKRA